MLKVKLSRDLRKNILRGHPWVYREAIVTPQTVGEACLCQVLDHKGQALGWGLYSSESLLALRILSTSKNPPKKKLYAERMTEALDLRKRLIDSSSTCFRLINGEGDRLPGFVCDVYGPVAVIQFDGVSCYQFWDQDFIADWLLQNLDIRSVYFKPRFSDCLESQSWGEVHPDNYVEVKENNIRFKVDFVSGQKTGFFLDQRDNRKYIQSLSEGFKVLNLFSYTGGFSLYAGAGGASEVVSVDIAPEAIKVAEEQWLLNGFQPKTHKAICTDVFDFIEKSDGDKDMVIVDPPSMTHSERNKNKAMSSYIDLFSRSAQLVAKGGHLVLSSCSSHISFQNFFEIIDESLSKSRSTGKILRVSGQGADHPFPHYCHELRYLKFVHIKLD